MTSVCDDDDDDDNNNNNNNSEVHDFDAMAFVGNHRK
jgi:hypothetical protein